MRTRACSVPSGAVRTAVAARASWPSRKTVASTGTASPTTALAGQRPSSTRGVTSSTGMRPTPPPERSTDAVDRDVSGVAPGGPPAGVPCREASGADAGADAFGADAFGADAFAAGAFGAAARRPEPPVGPVEEEGREGVWSATTPRPYRDVHGGGTSKPSRGGRSAPGTRRTSPLHVVRQTHAKPLTCENMCGQECREPSGGHTVGQRPVRGRSSRRTSRTATTEQPPGQSEPPSPWSTPARQLLRRPR